MRKIIALVILSFISFSTLSQVLLGNEVLVNQGFEALKGKRVGLITNPTGVDSRLRSTIDILCSPQAKMADVRLVALYAPEHGVRGDVPAGEKVENMVDKSGATVYSLYGNGYKPKPEMLKDIDVLVFDIQDIGSRSYTFISTLGLAMEAAAENGKEFVVLDRPNPLGGEKIEGIMVDPGFSSFVSKYPVPYIHGMTVGELAQLYNGEGFLKNEAQCQLTVVPMEGWSRDMLWQDTELEWVLTSPHIPQAKTAIYYPITGIVGELQNMNIGVGYTLPFEVFGAEWIDDAEKLSDNLNLLQIPGVRFRPIHFYPYYGSARGKNIHGVQVHVTDLTLAPLTQVMYYVMQELYTMYGKSLFEGAAADRISMFDKVSGGDRLRKTFVNSGYRTSSVVRMMEQDAQTFAKQRQKYLIY